MQKVVYCCDTCGGETNYQKPPITGPGFISRHRTDWVCLNQDTNMVLLCNSCHQILCRAHDLGIVLPEKRTSAIVGGMYETGSFTGRLLTPEPSPPPAASQSQTSQG